MSPNPSGPGPGRGDSPYQNIPPEPGSTLYIVTAEVDDPKGLNTEPGGRWRKEFATIQPDAEDAVRRFLWHCTELSVEPDTDTIEAKLYAPDAEAPEEMVRESVEWLADKNDADATMGAYPDPDDEDEDGDGQ